MFWPLYSHLLKCRKSSKNDFGLWLKMYFCVFSSFGRISLSRVKTDGNVHFKKVFFKEISWELPMFSYCMAHDRPPHSRRSTNKLSSTMPHQTWEKWVFNSQKRDYPAYYNLIWAGTHQHFNQLCCNCWYELEH